jgi:type 1 glutamine amidotransferase
MKAGNIFLGWNVVCSSIFLACCIGMVSLAQAQPKKVLVVTVTKGFRHSSIPTAEKVLGELASKSGAFTVDYVRNDDEMKEKMTAAALKQYDGVIFANTTGDLPLPDKQAFLDWIKSGKAFVGMHSATDTFDKHTPPDPYVEMIGGEFRTHGAQAEVDCTIQDQKHPACAALTQGWHVKDEIYLLNGFERDKVHGLITLDKHPNDKTPGDYPISWCKQYGKGKVFYTSLGHREDLWDTNTPKDFKRENSTDVSELYQKHILGGIKWALGLEKGDATPQTATSK